GSFIYHLRRLDPDRRLWVLRGDKVFYGMLSDPHALYEQHAKTEADVLDLIFRFDPTLIVVEEPQVLHELPGAELLRRTLKNHPERFRLERVIPLESDDPTFAAHALHIYRNLPPRNPRRTEMIEFKVHGLGRSLGAPIKQEER